MISNKNFKNKYGKIIFDNSSLNYHELLTITDNIAKVIKEERSLVFLLCDNNIETFTSYLGCIKNNSVILLLNRNIGNENLLNLINLYSPNYIILPNKISLIKLNYTEVSKFNSYIILKNNKSKKIDLHDELFLLINTSGTTGSSKLVKLTHNNVEHNSKNIINFLKINSSHTTITTLPFSYVYGLSIINTHFLKGASIILNTDSMLQKSFWNKFIKFKVNSFGGVPYTYELLNKIDFYSKDLSNLIYTTHAGGKLNTQVWNKINFNYKNLGIKFYSMYGASEATARMSYLPWKFSSKKIGSIGKAINEGTFLLKDENNKNINKNYKNGKLYYKGENVFIGYANNIKDLLVKDNNNSTLNTGDRAYKDKDNFYYVVGRTDNYVKIYGHRVNLSEIENKILNIGVTNLCKNESENIITVYMENKDKIDYIKKFIKNNLDLNINCFKFKIIKKFKINKNGKFFI